MIGHPIKEEPEKKMDKPDSAKMVDQGREDNEENSYRTVAVADCKVDKKQLIN